MKYCAFTGRPKGKKPSRPGEENMERYEETRRYMLKAGEKGSADALFRRGDESIVIRQHGTCLGDDIRITVERKMPCCDKWKNSFIGAYKWNQGEAAYTAEAVTVKVEYCPECGKKL